jgi:hypothetical protein
MKDSPQANPCAELAHLQISAHVKAIVPWLHVSDLGAVGEEKIAAARKKFKVCVGGCHTVGSVYMLALARPFV